MGKEGRQSAITASLSVGCSCSHSGFCELCGHEHAEVGLKYEPVTGNPLWAWGRQPCWVLTLVDFGTRTMYVFLSWLSVGSGDAAPEGLCADGFMSVHVYLRDFWANDWSPQVEVAPEDSISNSDLCGHTHQVAGGIRESDVLVDISWGRTHTVAPFPARML